MHQRGKTFGGLWTSGGGKKKVRIHELVLGNNGRDGKYQGTEIDRTNMIDVPETALQTHVES